MNDHKFIYTVIFFYSCSIYQVISADRGDSVYHDDTTSSTSSDDVTKESVQNQRSPIEFMPTTYIAKTVHGAHQYYNSSLSFHEAAVRRFWTNMDSRINPSVEYILDRYNGRANKKVELSFDFPFYGYPISNVTITTDGFLYTGKYILGWLPSSQYIAPLMTNFDFRWSDDSRVKYADNGTAFTVEWENLVLEAKPHTGEFTFQVTLHKNGDIVFVYKGVAVEQISDDIVKIGISDAYITGGNLLFDGETEIDEYHSVNFRRDDIKNWTIIYLRALPTCNEMDNCNDCLGRSTAFECKWCPSLNRCSTGFEKNRGVWLENKCELDNIEDGGSCSAIIAGNAAAHHGEEYDHSGDRSSANVLRWFKTSRGMCLFILTSLIWMRGI